MSHKLTFEWHDLRPYAVGFFKFRAGYVPPSMPVPYDWIGELKVTVYPSQYPTHYLTRRIEYKYLWVEFETVCYDCFKQLKPYLYGESETINYTTNLGDYADCELCGKLGIESNDIPF